MLFYAAWTTFAGSVRDRSSEEPQRAVDGGHRLEQPVAVGETDHARPVGRTTCSTVWSECRAMAADYFAEMAKRMLRVAGPALELSRAS